MESGQVDLAIGPLPQLRGGFFQRRLFRQKYVCLFRQGHALDRKRLSLADFKAADIENKLRPHGVKVPGITKIEPSELDATGRAKYFLITSKSGKTKVHSNDFRLWLDPMKLKSNRILSVDRKGDSFSFRGRGWGHGVGLCQFGMKQLADLGYSYEDILKYYYPGAQITKIKAAAGTPSTQRVWLNKAVAFLQGKE
jgi:SpoIID/LytB domain protein